LYEKFADLPINKNPLFMSASVYVYPVAPLPENSVCLVISAQNQTGFYCHLYIYFNHLTPKMWQKVELIFNHTDYSMF
jgi:hypothetical protein